MAMDIIDEKSKKKLEEWVKSIWAVATPAEKAQIIKQAATMKAILDVSKIKRSKRQKPSQTDK